MTETFAIFGGRKGIASVLDRLARGGPKALIAS
jgi:hypothetical protein